jgi:hypothetical protein
MRLGVIEEDSRSSIIEASLGSHKQDALCWPDFLRFDPGVFANWLLRLLVKDKMRVNLGFDRTAGSTLW